MCFIIWNDYRKFGIVIKIDYSTQNISNRISSKREKLILTYLIDWEKIVARINETKIWKIDRCFFFSMEGDSSPKLISSFCFTFVRRYLLCKFIMLAINYSINRAEPKGKTFSYFSFLKFHYIRRRSFTTSRVNILFNERDILDCTFRTTLISANTVYTPSEKYSPVARGKRFKWKNMATFIYARGKRRVELTYSYICVYIYIFHA